MVVQIERQAFVLGRVATVAVDIRNRSHLVIADIDVKLIVVGREIELIFLKRSLPFC